MDSADNITNLASEVRKELGNRYQRFQLRNRNYFRLISFLCFVALFLATLFLQRNANVSYQVYNTVATGLLPDPTAIGTTDDVFTWLDQLVENVWKDPVCGDGVCEVPFEYASYGRFGCRADCGRLQDIQNLTSIQIDLYYDFTHPSSSIPATELMNQASWNLCPATGTGGCYWADDQAFGRLTGSISQTVPDVPDGNWAVVIKRDIFDKVRGAVRSVPLLDTQALGAKVALALQAAATCRAAETASLQQALTYTQDSFFKLLNATLLDQYTGGLVDARTKLTSGVYTASQYAAAVASLGQTWNEVQQNITLVAQSCPAELPPNASDPAVSPACLGAYQAFNNMTDTVLDYQLDQMRSVINLRLAPLRALSDGIVTAGLQQLLAVSPEIYTVVAASYGQDGTNPEAVSASVLAQYYIDGPYTVPPPAKAALGSRLIAASDMTASVLAAKCQARIDELAREATNVNNLPEVVLALHITQSGAGLDYNFISWDGGAQAYEACDLESRTPQYAGSCTTALSCNTTQYVDGQGKTQVQYLCQGTSLDSDSCGDQCDTQQLCTALCSCDMVCGTEQVCTCSACTKVPSARTDSDYLAMEALAGAETASASAQSFWSLNIGGGRRRALTADSTTTMLSSIMTAIGQLEDSQTSLSTSVQQLQTQVAAANAAEASTTLATLISTGQQQILTGQTRIQSLLNEIIGKQDAAATAAAATAQALANLQTLQQQQLQAQQELAQAYSDKIDAIKSALQQGYLSLSQALELYRQARLQNLVSYRDALLATEPCMTQTAVEHSFTILRYQEATVDTSRVRQLGLTNRVLAGLLLFSQRDSFANCTGTRFSNIDNQCDAGMDLEPYGVDPVFKLGTSLYNADLDNTDSMVAYYNCSQLASPTYNVTVVDSEGQQVTNAPPYCMDLYNPRNLPYGFHSTRLRRLGDGFPAVLDINLSQDDVQTWLSYLQEGLYLGTLTRSLLAQLVTYNDDLHLFSASSVFFDFTTSGSVKVSYKIETLRADMYVTNDDKVRLAMEIILIVWITYMAAMEGRGLYLALRRSWNPLSYFKDGWHVVDFFSTVLLVVDACLWIALLSSAKKFQISLRYDVYQDLDAEAAFLTLADGGAGLQAMHESFGSLQDLSNTLSWYYALNGINLLLLISRMLQLMDFQPRLGVVTRSLAHAGPDLLHFCLVFSMVFIGYAMLAHLIFGNSIEGFSSFGTAVQTCFAMLLGNTDVNDDLKALTGLQGVAGALFFWSYEILVFLVLLNFLLAIIVDAFGEVKSRTTDTTGIHTELAQIVSHLYHSAMGRARGSQVDDGALTRLLGDWQENAGAPTGGGGGDGGGLTKEGAGHCNNSKRLYVAGKEIAEDQLKTILQGQLLDEEREEGDLESLASPRGPMVGCGPFLPRRGASPSRRVLRGSAADVDEVAHYVMLRFGEKQAEREATEDPVLPDKIRQQQQEPANQPASPGGNFSIGAFKADSPAAGSSNLGLNGPGQNGQRLAGTIRAEVEQSELQAMMVSLVNLHQGLRETQQQVLSLQHQLMAQQGSILQAVQPPGSSGGGAYEEEQEDSVAAGGDAVDVRSHPRDGEGGGGGSSHLGRELGHIQRHGGPHAGEPG